MATSLPSSPFTVIDVPEIKKFEGSFNYNFFVADEGVNDDGTIPRSVIAKSSGKFDADLYEQIDFKKYVPRFVKFDFSPVKLKHNSNEFTSAKTSGKPVNLSKNIDKIVNEERFSDYSFVGFEVQDSNIDGKLYFFVSGTVSARLNNFLNPNERKGGAPDPKNLTLLDVASVLNELTPPEIDGDIAMASVNQPNVNNTFFFKAGKTVVNDIFKSVKNLSVRTRLNSLRCNTVLRNTINDSNSIFTDELVPLVEITKALQNKALAKVSNSVNEGEYNTALDYVSAIASTSNVVEHTSRVIGYIIDKYEINDDGSFSPRDSIILQGEDASRAVDFKVKYGSKYSYSIRTIVEVSFVGTDLESDSHQVIKALIASRPKNRIEILCTEDVPPPPPADFNVVWDYALKKPKLLWNFPVNQQRDIKKFQIFRRKSISEPFELIKMFNFDDSALKLTSFETPEASLVEFSEFPTQIFVDYDFKKDASYIYALCSEDAHGISSGFSIQYHISFDRMANKLKKKMISSSGAPKSYPNLYLLNDTFVNSILDSGHSHVKVIFNPEFLKVVDAKGNDLRILSTDATGGFYRLQFINVDLQKQQVLKINLNDKTVKKNNLILKPPSFIIKNGI